MPSKPTKRKLRADATKRYLNPATGRIIGVEGAKKRAWDALARYVRHIEPVCCTCGAQTTEAGHWLHNTDKENQKLGGNELWYEIRNIHGQCGKCNRHKSSNPVKYALFMEEKYGMGIIQELYKLYRTPKKFSIPELLEIERKYIELLETHRQMTFS